MLGPGIEATFIPGDLPRDAGLAFWSKGDTLGEDEVEFVLPAGSTVRRRTVRARLVPIRDLIDDLVCMGPAEDVTTRCGRGRWRVGS